MFRKLIGAFLGLAMLGVTGTALIGPAHAAIVSWDDAGQGVSGTDPFGHDWLFSNVAGSTEWSIPGSGLGVETWTGSGALTTLQISFASSFWVESLGTLGGNATNGVFWDVDVAGPNVTFTSPLVLGYILPGDAFFFLADFGTTGSGEIFFPFDAEYTVSAVPLPAALPLMGSGLALLGLLGWRRKRAAAA